ncbi:MAG: CapA family protein [bacterium]
MKFAFTGDLSFKNIDRFTDNPFKDISHLFKEYNLVINLESVFMPDGSKKEQIKNKISLKQNESSIELLRSINPYLVNLSNNHINDYGNFGVNYTRKILGSIKSFGAGYDYETHNVFALKNEKIVFISYATRNTDLSGSRLFNTDNFMGPKKYSLELFKKQSSDYKKYRIIVLLHWGFENIHYPLQIQRDTAGELIDNGTDLIIGNHSHLIQGYEKYKDRWIFYSLGNFLFPEFKYSHRGVQYSAKQYKQNKESIIPMFSIDDSITLDKVVTIEADRNYNLHVSNKRNHYNTFLFKNTYIYRIFYFTMKIKRTFNCYWWPLKRRMVNIVNRAINKKNE